MLLVGACLWTGGGAALGQGDGNAVSPPNDATIADAELTTAPVLNVERLQGRLAAMDDPGDLAEDVVAEAKRLYQQAIARLREAEADRVRAAELRAAIDAVPERLAEARAQLAQPASEPEAPATADATLDDVKARLREARATLEQRQATSAALEAEAQQRQARRVEAPKLLAAARQELSELQATETAADTALPPALIQARQAHRQAKQAAMEARIDVIEAELASYDARAELLTHRRDLATRAVAEAEKIVALWQERLRAREARELARKEAQTSEAVEQAEQIHPAAAELARENQAIVTELAEVADRRKLAEAESARLRTQHSAMESKWETIKSKADATARPSEAFGMILRRMREELPDPRRLSQQMERRNSEIERVQLKLIDLDQRRSELADLGSVLEGMMRDLGPNFSNGVELQRLRGSVAELLSTKRQLLTDLYTEYDRYFNDLIELDNLNERTAQAVDSYMGYIDERVLWVRSTGVLSLSVLKPTREATGWLVYGERWRGVMRALAADAGHRPSIYVVSGLGVVLAVLLRVRSRRQLQTIAEKMGTEADRFSLTLKALLPTLAQALPLPLLFWLLGWRLHAVTGEALFAEPLAEGFRAAGTVLFTFALLRQVVAPRGLGEAHFRWREDQLKPLRRHLPWLGAIYVIAIGVIFATEYAVDEDHATSLGRLVFIVAQIALLVAAVLLLHPTRGVLADRLQSKPDGWVSRLRIFWYPVAVAVPIVFAGLSAWGYHYTALQLEGRLFATVWLVLGLVLANAMVRRWLFVERRRLILEQRRRRRAELEAARAAAQQSGEDAGATPDESLLAVETEEPQLDVYTINVQTRKLISAATVVVLGIGLWAVWADILPALGYLDRVALWQDVDTTVSLANLIGALIIAVLTFVAARNIPGLLEILALQRLPLEPGVRFAITTIFRYCVVIAGLILTFAAIEVGWSKVQWLAAAVTVGLGFGLQEIFANFVSGLIILFEQPIRVGDIVTVGDVTGIVSRIQIRATTITDWDRKEYIVPNKEFVTGRMLNWSLSDSINRVTVAVGVAYGSDTEKARELLAKVAKQNPTVLDDPAPIITFEGFGDSTLDMKLRAYLPNMDNRLTVIHELHTAVDREFRKAGIEIAFPQRDLHIRSSDVPLGRGDVPTNSGAP